MDWRNLLLAYRRCRRRKRYRQPATEFDFAWEENLLSLQRELQTGEYCPGAYEQFHISDPKPRLISAAPFRDRVVHHAIVNVLEPLFERSFVADSYACRLGRGTHKAIQRAQQFQKRYAWCLKTDIVKFFPSVDHEVMLGVLQQKVGDARLLKLLQLLLASGEGVAGDDGGPVWFPGDDLLSVLRPRGLPIGNLTSQFFANVLLNPVDHFIKEVLRIPGYLRYADDLLLFSDDRQQLWWAVESLRERLGQYRLRLHPRKTHVQPTDCWLPWLGMRILGSCCRISQQGIQRFVRRMRRQRREYAAGTIDAARIRQSLHAWLGHVSGVTEARVLQVLMRQHCVFSR